MRGYSVGTTALALEVDAKWLDNLLSQNRVAGVSQSRQGVQRRISPAAMHVIATIHQLNRELQLPIGAALRIAHAMWEIPQSPEPPDAAAVQSGEIELRLDRAALRARVAAAVAEALEMAPRPKRGRPPRKGRTSGDLDGESKK